MEEEMVYKTRSFLIQPFNGGSCHHVETADMILQPCDCFRCMREEESNLMQDIRHLHHLQI